MRPYLFISWVSGRSRTHNRRAHTHEARKSYELCVIIIDAVWITALICSLCARNLDTATFQRSYEMPLHHTSCKHYGGVNRAYIVSHIRKLSLSLWARFVSQRGMCIPTSASCEASVWFRHCPSTRITSL